MTKRNQLLPYSGFPLQKILIPVLVGILLQLPSLLPAQGNLLVTPRRVVFEGNKQNQEINLANTGQDTAVYAISFIQYRMNTDGSFEEITDPDPGQFFADKYIRYFPRTVTLAPNESQVVRLQLRRNPDMVNGEYRSHMYFRAVPKEQPLGENDALADTNTIGIRLTPIFGITIPVIIRVGDDKPTAAINNMKFNIKNDTVPELQLELARTGNFSVYGDLTVQFVPEKGAATDVGVVRGIAVYTPINTRQFNMDLRPPADVVLTKGKLVVKYSSTNENKPEVLAVKELILP